MSGAPEPGARRPYVRLALLLLLAATWLLPWAEVQAPVTGGVVEQSGAARTGLPAFAALLLLWALALTAVLGGERRHLQAGEAFAAAALAGATCLLLALEHPFLPAGGRVGAWLPVFAPLALLALLDGGTRLVGGAGAREITAVRVVAALFAAGTLLADGAPVAAALAAWVALAPLAFALGRDAWAARRSLEALLLAAALCAGFAPTLARRVAPVAEPVGGVHVAALAWSLLAALVVLTTTAALLAPREPTVRA